MSKTLRIALVTARPRPEVNTDLDMAILLSALGLPGVEASAVAWDDPAADWSSYDLAVIRSTWDYTWRYAEFMAWVQDCSSKTLLLNPASAIAWNSNKTYLQELSVAGIPVVETRYLEPGAEIRVDGLAEFVVKPAIGAGARYAARYSAQDVDLARRHIAHLHSDGITAMVQPYMNEIDRTGERALVFIDGALLLAIRKNAVLAPGLSYDAPRDGHPGLQLWDPTPAELDLAKQVIGAIPMGDDILFARVDMVMGNDGQPCLAELELVEPNFYLRVDPKSASVAARLIVRAAQGRGHGSGVMPTVAHSGLLT